MGNPWNRLEGPAFIAVSKPLLKRDVLFPGPSQGAVDIFRPIAGVQPCEGLRHRSLQGLRFLRIRRRQHYR